MTEYFIEDGKLYQKKQIQEWGSSQPTAPSMMGGESLGSWPACPACSGVKPMPGVELEFIQEIWGHREDCPIKELLYG